MANRTGKQTGGPLERSDGLVMQREIGKGLMVMEESALSRRRIIRQAANAELLAADLHQSLVYLSCLHGSRC